MEGSTQYNEEDEHFVYETLPKAKATYRRRFRDSTISPGSKGAGELDCLFEKVQVMIRAELSVLRNDIEREMYARLETYKEAVYADMRKEMEKEMFDKREEMYAALKIELHNVEVKVMACVMQKRVEDAVIAFESWKSNAEKRMNEKEALIEGLKGEIVGCKNIPMKEGETPPSMIRELESIKEQEEEDEKAEQEDGRQEKGGLSESGLELKKLLGKSAVLDESGDDKSSDDDNDLDNKDISSPVLAPKHKEGPKEEPVESTPAKVASVEPGRTASASSTASKGKRKSGADESKPNVPTSSKKVKMESSQEDGKQAKDSAAMGSSSTKGAGSPPKANGTPPKAKPSSQVLEEDVKAVLRQAGPIKVHDLVNEFKYRLATKKDRQAFAAVLKNIATIRKTGAGNFIVLKNIAGQSLYLNHRGEVQALRFILES